MLDKLKRIFTQKNINLFIIVSLLVYSMVVGIDFALSLPTLGVIALYGLQVYLDREDQEWRQTMEQNLKALNENDLKLQERINLLMNQQTSRVRNNEQKVADFTGRRF